jgi:uncharacterized protein (TIGR00251 family)
LSEPLAVEACAGGARLAVRAQPGARREGVLGLWNGRLKVALRAPPEAGRANDELCGVLAAALGLRPGDVELRAGARSRHKSVFVPLAPEVVRARLLPLIEGAQ